MQSCGEGTSKDKESDSVVKESKNASVHGPEEAETAESGLDLDRLAEALEKVPLHGRLSLPKDVYLPEQIAEFEQNAAHRLKSFEEKLKSIVNAEIKPDPAYDALQRVNASSTDRRDQADDQNGDYDDYDDDEEVDPNNVVDWLDKVLSN